MDTGHLPGHWVQWQGKKGPSITDGLLLLSNYTHPFPVNVLSLSFSLSLPSLSLCHPHPHPHPHLLPLAATLSLSPSLLSQFICSCTCLAKHKVTEEWITLSFPLGQRGTSNLGGPTKRVVSSLTGPTYTIVAFIFHFSLGFSTLKSPVFRWPVTTSDLEQWGCGCLDWNHRKHHFGGNYNWLRVNKNDSLIRFGSYKKCTRNFYARFYTNVTREDRVKVKMDPRKLLRAVHLSIREAKGWMATFVFDRKKILVGEWERMNKGMRKSALTHHWSQAREDKNSKVRAKKESGRFGQFLNCFVIES